MKKTIVIIFAIIIAVIGIWGYLRFVVGGDEDTWICENGEWVKHGVPSAPKPTSGCGETNTNTVVTNTANINALSNTYSQPVVEDPGLVVHWTFNENTGDVILDTSSGHSGKIYGNAEWITGKIRSALSFDGVNDYVDLSQKAQDNAVENTLSTISNLTQGTIAFWFKYTSTLDEQAVIPIFYLGAADENAQSNMFIIEIGHGNTESGGYGGLNPDNKMLYTTWIKNNQEPFLCFDSNVNIEENTWHHFAVVVGPDGNTGYLNGEEITNRDYNFGQASDTSFLSSIPVAEKLMFGYGRTHHAISPDFVNMTGSLDDVRIYNRPLTANEIQELVD